MSNKNVPVLSWMWVAIVAAVFGAYPTPAVAGAPSAADLKLTKVIDIATMPGEVTALYEPKSKTVVLLVAQAPVVGTSVRPRVFAGTSTLLFDQILYSNSKVEGELSVALVAPRAQPRGLADVRLRDQKYSLVCDLDDDTATLPLTLMPEAELQTIRSNATFRTSALVHTPVALARDEAGVYYYVDRLRQDIGGEGFRVYVGKRGALKLLPLRDVAIDRGGTVFATPKGDLAISIDAGERGFATWKNRGKVRQLMRLDTFVNSYLIHRELGVYAGLGTPCDDQ